MSSERDLRKYARSTQRRLVVGFFLVLIVIGNGLIWFFYGNDAVQFALICTLIALSPATLIVGALWMMEKLLRSAELERIAKEYKEGEQSDLSNPDP